MIIGVDGNEANVNEKVGVSVYTSQLLYYFKNKSNSQLRFIIYLRNQPLNDMPKVGDYFQYKIIPGPFLWSQIFLPLYLFLHNNINVFFSPAHYSPRFCPVPTVVTIHDLAYFYYPNDFLKKDLNKLLNWTKYSVNKAKKIIAVSKATKKDIEKYYQISDEKIEIIYNGYEKKIQKLINKNQEELHKLKNKKPYILYVGTLQPRKNVSTLIKAFKLFSKENPNFKLIIAGKKGWLYDQIFTQIEKLALEKRIEFLDYVSDEKLINLYKNAFCFVLPSLYEGFGIPILEAMSYSCPVIASYVSSLPEIGNNACLYFDPKNENDLFEKMQILINNSQLKQELIKKGREQIKLFSWEKCAEQTLSTILNSVI